MSDSPLLNHISKHLKFTQHFKDVYRRPKVNIMPINPFAYSQSKWYFSDVGSPSLGTLNSLTIP